MMHLIRNSKLYVMCIFFKIIIFGRKSIVLYWIRFGYFLFVSFKKYFFRIFNLRTCKVLCNESEYVGKISVLCSKFVIFFKNMRVRFWKNVKFSAQKLVFLCSVISRNLKEYVQYKAT